MNTPSPSPAFPTAWRTLRSAPAMGAHNMAVDATLLDHGRDRGYGVWRTYAWERPTVSFGRHEAVRTRFDAQSLSDAGLDAVRRPTGGRALLHAAEVTYSVTMPIADRTPWQAVYADVNDILLRALRALGVAAALVHESTAVPVRPEGPVCFDHPAAGEIVVAGAKLVGSAVWRERGAYLQHGSILLRNDQSLLSAAMCASPSALDRPSGTATALEACLAVTPSWKQVADALEQALRAAVEHRHAGELSAQAVSLDAEVLARHEIRFRDPAWLWRR
jgi:lipoyl(octanoyl) transferase